ncbi:hypothetical protein [Kitasatospora sp. NPDC001175]|uniref:hypothetical protein n=1 Tax=Kitasatospora sp. NPDC001175 TaxID=3157103 RepID=UPI003D0478C6
MTDERTPGEGMTGDGPADEGAVRSAVADGGAIGSEREPRRTAAADRQSGGSSRAVGAGSPGLGTAVRAEEAEPADEVMERRLREMLHQSVTEVQPDPAALLRIRQAVPRRRARQRNLWTGAVAVVLLVAAAVPTIKGVQHLDLSDGAATGHAVAESDRQSQVPPSEDGGAGRSHLPRPAGSADRSGTAAPGSDASSAAASPSPGADGSPAGNTPVPDCVRADLGDGSSHLSTADGSGKVYGWFTVFNTSGRSCELTGPGTVAVSSADGGPAPKVRVLDHQAGDPAIGLPDPGPATGLLVLPPKGGYQIRFGWVPDLQCPKAGGGPASPVAPAPQAAPSVAAAPGAEASPQATASPSAAPSPSSSPPPSTPSSITLAHTPESGGPAAATTQVSAACTGTLYRTAPEAVPAAGAQPPSDSPTSGSAGQ